MILTEKFTKLHKYHTQRDWTEPSNSKLPVYPAQHYRQKLGLTLFETSVYFCYVFVSKKLSYLFVSYLL